MIYWVAIEEVPTKKESEEQSSLPKLILAPMAVEARDDKDAALKVALDPEVGKKLEGVDRNRITVIVRPF